MVKEFKTHVPSKCQQGSFQYCVIAFHSGIGCFYVHVVPWEKMPRINSFYRFNIGEQCCSLEQVRKSQFNSLILSRNTLSTFQLQRKWNSSPFIYRIKILTWLREFMDKITNFSRLHCLAIPRKMTTESLRILIYQTWSVNVFLYK